MAKAAKKEAGQEALDQSRRRRDHREARQGLRRLGAAPLCHREHRHDRVQPVRLHRQRALRLRGAPRRGDAGQPQSPLLRVGLSAVAIQLSGRPLSRAGGHTIPKSRSFRHLGVSDSKSRRRGFRPAL